MNRFIKWLSDKLLNQKGNHLVSHFLFYFLFILPLVIMSVLSLVSHYKILTKSALDRRENISFLAAATMKEKLDRVIDVGISLATRVQFQRHVESGAWDEAINIMQRVPALFPDIERVVLFDKEGILRSVMPLTPEISSVIGQDFSYRDYYQGVSKNWQPYVAEIIKPAVPLGYNLVPVAIPIKSESGEAIGFLLLNIKLETITDWSKNIDVGEAGFVYIVDQIGNLVAHPTLLPAEEIIDFSSVPIVQKILQGSRGLEISFNPIEKEERLTAYRPIEKYGWGVIVQEPTKSAFADRRMAMAMYGGIYALFILFGLLLAYLILKMIHLTNQYRQKEKAMLESIGDGVVAIDRSWNVVLWNKAAAKITGWLAEEIMGKPLRDFVKFVKQQDRAENIAFIEEAMLFGRVGIMSNNTVLIQKDGNEIPVGDSAAPIFDPGGKVAGAIIVFRDVSQEKEDRSLKSDFAYASHQLNTPVTKALWNLEMALDEKDNVKIKEKVKIAYQSAKSIQKLNTQLYIVSEIDQKITVPKYENVRLISVIDEIVSNFKNKCQKCGINLNVEPISSVLGIKTDPKILKRILLEVIENALFYNRPGGKIDFKITSDENSLLFEVTDTGIGIPAEQQSLVFTKFFRGNNFDTTEIIGAGLGLFISKSYTELLGGKIWFSSEGTAPAVGELKKDKGTTFYITLPVK